MKIYFLVFCLASFAIHGAEVKITDLPAASAVTTDDLLMIVNDPAGTPANQKITTANFKASIYASPVFTGVPTIPTPFTLGAVSVLPTGTELNFVDGVTSAIQTQLDLKSPLASPTFTGTTIIPIHTSGAADPADAGAIRLGNAELIEWEASPAGTDVTLTVNSAEQFVFSNDILSPSLVTPVLGVATATTVNKVTITAPATSATLTVADGKTLSVTESVTLNRQSSTGIPVQFCVACSDELSSITTGTSKITFRAPFAFTLTELRASVNTAPTGSTILIDVNEALTTVISTKLMIDASEKTSTTATTAYVISDSAIADDAEISIDFDQVGSTIPGAGVKVWIKGYR